MKEQFVTYEIALKLKELGFNESCLGYYTITNKGLLYPYNMYEYIYRKDFLCAAPLWQQVIDWFRDKHHTNIEINRFPNISKWGFIVTDMTIIPKQQTRKENINMSLKVTDVRGFDEYFECREQAILKAIESCQKEK